MRARICFALLVLFSFATLCNADQQLVDLLNKVKPSVVRVETADGFGTGFIVDQDIVVTNHHVIDGSRQVTVCYSDGTEVKSTGVLYLDEASDIAVIKASTPAGVKPLPVATAFPQVGEDTVAIGHSKGFMFSPSEGIVSGVRPGRNVDENLRGTWVQTTAPISTGNSGGPLLTRLGTVIGMNTFIRRDAQNVNLAISSVDLTSAIAAAKIAPAQKYADVFPPAPMLPPATTGAPSLDLSNIDLSGPPDPRFFEKPRVLAGDIRRILLRRNIAAEHAIESGTNPMKALQNANMLVLKPVAEYLIKEGAQPSEALVEAARLLVAHDGSRAARLVYGARQAAFRSDQARNASHLQLLNTPHFRQTLQQLNRPYGR
ncbi:S1C family serine protease [Crocinitomicaceae bacterium]|nr:S1C family serine protease [Crocinitomicaceae bacterium]